MKNLVTERKTSTIFQFFFVVCQPFSALRHNIPTPNADMDANKGPRGFPDQLSSPKPPMNDFSSITKKVDFGMGTAALRKSKSFDSFDSSHSLDVAAVNFARPDSVKRINLPVIDMPFANNCTTGNAVKSTAISLPLGPFSIKSRRSVDHSATTEPLRLVGTPVSELSHAKYPRSLATSSSVSMPNIASKAKVVRAPLKVFEAAARKVN